MTERETEPPFHSHRIVFAETGPFRSHEVLRRLEEEGYLWSWTESRADAEHSLRTAPCSVLVADLNLDGSRSLELLGVARQLPDPPAIVLVAANPTLEAAMRCVKLKVDAFLAKPYLPSQLLLEIRDAIFSRNSRITDVRALFQPHPAGPPPELELEQLLAQHPSLACLTKREQQVLLRVVRGADVPAISSGLFISPHTVRNHLKAIYRKLNVRSRVELVVRFGGAGIGAAELATG